MDERNKETQKKRKERDEKYYWWICTFFASNGIVPNYREMAEQFGWTRERARQIYHRLGEQGYVRWLPKAKEHKQTPWAINMNPKSKINIKQNVGK